MIQAYLNKDSCSNSLTITRSGNPTFTPNFGINKEVAKFLPPKII